MTLSLWVNESKFVKIALSVFLLCLSFDVYAVPAFPQLIYFQLDNGTGTNIVLKGDEYCPFWL